MAEQLVRFKDANGNYLLPTTKASIVVTEFGGNLGTVEPGAQVNKIESVKVNGTALTITGKAVNIQLPDTSDFVTAADVAAAVASAGHLKRQVVASLPTTGIDANTIYLVPSATSKAQNAKDEYLYVDGAWEMIGTSQTDLAGYVKSTDLTSTLASYAKTANVYTKTEVDTKVSAKANSADVYAKTEVYKKSEVDGMLSAAGASAIAYDIITG